MCLGSSQKEMQKFMWFEKYTQKSLELLFF